MALIAPASSVSVTIAAGATTGTIAGDVSAYTVPGGSTLAIGSRNGEVGSSIIIQTWTANGTSGATFTLAEPYSTSTSYTNAAFVINTQAFTGSATGLAVAGLQRVISYLTRLLGADTNADSSSKTLTLDRGNDGTGTIGRLVHSIVGRLWFQVSHRTVTQGGVNVQRWALQTSLDGTSTFDSIAVDGASGGVDALATSTDVASAATTDLGSAATKKVNITGTTAITSFGSGAHKERLIRFSGALTLTHNATSLALPGGANITTAANDLAHATSDASGNWTVRSYTRATGKPVVNPSRADLNIDTTQAVTFAGVSVVASPNPIYELWDNGGTGVTNRRRYALFVYAGQFGIQSRNDDGSYRSNPLTIDTSGNMQLAGNYAFSSDNTYSLGTPSSRATNIYATGTITSSDARLKTDVAPLSEAELAAARDLVGGVGTFQFLDRIALKGSDKARHHVGLTVQGAIAIMESHGLDPLRYSFICYDRWDAVPATEQVLDSDGLVIVEARPAKPAGDRYSFDYDQLAMFVAASMAAENDTLKAIVAALGSRLAALEARASA